MTRRHAILQTVASVVAGWLMQPEPTAEDFADLAKLLPPKPIPAPGQFLPSFTKKYICRFDLGDFIPREDIDADAYGFPWRVNSGPR